MSKKKGRIVYVEGCPCEVIEEDTEAGIVKGDARTLAWSLSDDAFAQRPLAVAPDGSFVLLNPFANGRVDHTQPDEGQSVANLRRLAREMRP